MTKSSENIWVFDSNRDILSNWREADPLNYAWFGFAAHEAKEKYRDSGDRLPNLAKSLEFDMQIELRSQIANGTFLALGIQVSPIPKSDPEQIPPLCFEIHDVDIDWQNGSLSGLGRSFQDVRVCMPADNSRAANTASPATRIVKRGGGRPSQYPRAREILEILFHESRHFDQPAGKLIVLFNERFVARFGTDAIKVAPISQRSLQDYLDRYRKELAETGNI